MMSAWKTGARRLGAALAMVLAAGGAALALPSSAHAATLTADPCSPAARACVDLATQQAWLTNGSRVIYGPVHVRTGRPSFPTAPGTFHVTYKDRNHVSSIYHQAMPYAVFFNGGDAFHQGSLAVSSHGCVHLTRGAAQTFFATLQVGNEVQVVR